VKLPICVRVTVWYAALFGVTVTLLGGFLVVQLRADLTEGVDDRLRVASVELARSLVDEGDDEPADRDEPGEDLADFRETARTMLPPAEAGAQLLDAQGRRLVSHGLSDEEPPAVPADVRADAVAGAPQTLTLPRGDQGEHYRVRVTSIEVRGDSRLLVLEESLDSVEGAVQRVLVLLLVAGPVALLVTSVGAFWIARKAVEPVERITTDANEISIDRLDDRVAVPNANDEIRRLAETLNSMLARIEQGVVEKHRLVADASHELRTPLAVMRSEIDVALAAGDLDVPAREVLVSAREEVDKIALTVDNLLTSAQIDEGNLELLTTPTDLRSTVEEAVRSLLPLATTKRLRLVASGDSLEVQGDPLRLQLLLTNLVDNAIKFSPPDGTVRVHTWSEGAEVGVTVADEGPGIKDSEKPQLFSRYYRVDEPLTARTGGSGLGLAICRQVALAHGGDIRVQDQPEGGSAFSLVLPSWRSLEVSGSVGATGVGAPRRMADDSFPA
jgi:two-component system, OmpR family, sensor kinase